MDASVQRFMRRHLPSDDALDAVAAVHASLASQMAAQQFSDSHRSWSQSTPPAIEEVAEFERFFWRLARLRLLDELRKKYLRSRTVPFEDHHAAGEGPQAMLEAREFLLRLAQLVDNLPARDRELLMLASDPSTAAPAHLTNADRVRLHRLRRALAQRIWLERATRGHDSDR